MKRARAVFDSLRRLSPPLRWLAALAAARYLCDGVFLGLFSDGFDFHVIHEAAAQVARGQGAAIYDAFLAFKPGASSLFFMYPPAVAAILSPLGRLDFQSASLLFMLIVNAAAWLAFWLWARRAPVERRWILFSMTFLFAPLYYSLQIGQTEALALLCLVGGVLLFDAGWEALAALLFALAVVLKLFLALPLLYFAARGRWRFLFYCAAALCALFAMGLAAVPWPAQAPYWSRLLAPIGIESFYDNQSLGGFLHRLLTASRYTTGVVDAPGLARALQSAFSAALAAAFVWLVRRARPGTAAGVSLGIVTSLLAAPHADTHHQALLLPVFWSLWDVEGGLGMAACYGFFAMYTPVVAYKFLSPDRLVFFALGGARNVVFSLPFLALGALWLLCARRVLSGRALA